jgi:hypothetical protein
VISYNKEKNVFLCVNVYGNLGVACIDEWQQIIWISRDKTETVFLTHTSVLHIRNGWCFFHVNERVNTKGIKCVFLDLLPQKHTSYSFSVTVDNVKELLTLGFVQFIKYHKKMESAESFEMLMHIYQTTWHHVPKRQKFTFAKYRHTKINWNYLILILDLHYYWSI